MEFVDDWNVIVIGMLCSKFSLTEVSIDIGKGLWVLVENLNLSKPIVNQDIKCVNSCIRSLCFTVLGR